MEDQITRTGYPTSCFSCHKTRFECKIVIARTVNVIAHRVNEIASFSLHFLSLRRMKNSKKRRTHQCRYQSWKLARRGREPQDSMASTHLRIQVAPFPRRVPFETISGSSSKNVQSLRITMWKGCQFGALFWSTRTGDLLFPFTPLKRVLSTLLNLSAINADALVRLEFDHPFGFCLISELGFWEFDLGF
ncbi:hypothetical protein LguiA_005468 [Lonicera macranthoides]